VAVGIEIDREKPVFRGTGDLHRDRKRPVPVTAEEQDAGLDGGHRVLSPVAVEVADRDVPDLMAGVVEGWGTFEVEGGRLRVRRAEEQERRPQQRHPTRGTPVPTEQGREDRGSTAEDSDGAVQAQTPVVAAGRPVA